MDILDTDEGQVFRAFAPDEQALIDGGELNVFHRESPPSTTGAELRGRVLDPAFVGYSESPYYRGQIPSLEGHA